MINKSTPIRSVIASVVFGCCALPLHPPTLASNQATTPTPSQAFEANALAALEAGELALDQQSFIFLVLMRNPDVQLTRQRGEIAEQQLKAERGAYLPELFANVNSDSNEVRNNPDPLLDLDPTSIDRNRRFGVGVRALASSGTELTLEYNAHRQISNITTNTNPTGLDDLSGRLGFKIRQPFLRGLGAAQLEGRILQAERQLEISRHELRQQMLSKSFDALSVYWRLYRAQRLRQLNNEALSFSQKMLRDIEALAAAGRLPETAVIEAKSAVLLREADAFAAEQTFAQVKTSVFSLLNLSAPEKRNASFKATQEPALVYWDRPESLGDYLAKVEKTWPNLEIALQRLAIERANIEMAKDEMRPRLDFIAGYNNNSRRFDHRYEQTFKDALRDDFSGWNAGLEFSIPLGVNTSARARRDMAIIKARQSELEVDAVRKDLANQVQMRFEQLEQALEEAKRHQRNVGLLKQLVDVQRIRFSAGSARLGDLIDQEDKLTSGVLRLVDAEIRYELARAALQLSDGSLLRELNLAADGSFSSITAPVIKPVDAPRPAANQPDSNTPASVGASVPPDSNAPVSVGASVPPASNTPAVVGATLALPALPEPQPASPLAEAQSPLAPLTEVDISSVVGSAFEQWVEHWQQRNSQAYLALYDVTRPDLKDHLAKRSSRIRGARFIEVSVSDVIYETTGPSEVTVRFIQSYRSDTYQSRDTKELVWRMDGRQPRIVAERLVN